ncbi:MAG: lysylphosphatidylglycerol synthase transmembrane domain-containing protein [Pyrinomonadaceae bacterium]
MKKYGKLIALSILAILILWFFGRNLDWGLVLASLRKARAGYIIIATLVICLGYLLRAIRWQVLLAPITPSSIWDLFATTTVGFTAVFFVGRMGEIVRPVWLPMLDKRVRPAAALVTIGVERIFDLASLICFFAVNLIWFTPPAGRVGELDAIKLMGYSMLLGTAIGFIGLYIYRLYSAPIISWFDRFMSHPRFPKQVRRILLSLMKQLATSLEVLTDWREILSITFWTILLWVSIAIPTWFVMLAFDLPLNFSDALFVMGFAAVGSVVPTPGGAAGAFHAATANGLIFLNTPKETAFAVSIVMHLVYFAPAVAFGLYYFIRGELSFAGFREMLSANPTAEEG